MTAAETFPSPAASSRRLLVGVVGVLVLAALFVAGMLWAKWLPYANKASGLSSSHSWAGGSMLAESGTPGAAPSIAGAWRFTTTYLDEVWKGFAVALLVAAAVDALVPRAWLTRVLNRRSRVGQALAGGTAALPSLMCTCCTAPLAVGLRRGGVGTAAALAYWVGNPVLNPAVLVFWFLVAPWQFGVVRLVVGIPLVFGASALVARLSARGRENAAAIPSELLARDAEDPVRLRQFPMHFTRSFVRLALLLIPAYVAVVFLIGWVSGWLSAFSALDARLGILAVVACALIGTLLVVPTGGEIPIVLALTATGAAVGTAGALLITLPALSVPSMVMVGRAFSWRVTVAMAGAVAVAGLVAATLLWALL